MRQTSDLVDAILDQWSEERPELDTSSLGVVMSIASLHREFLKTASEAIEPLELELFEYDVLSTLLRQGEPFSLSATQLSRQSELSTGAMTNRIDRLESKGLVRRLPDPDDRRGVRVALTGSGRRVVEAAIQRRLSAADRSLSSITREEQDFLAGLLRKLRTGAQPAEPVS